MAHARAHRGRTADGRDRASSAVGSAFVGVGGSLWEQRLEAWHRELTGMADLSPLSPEMAAAEKKTALWWSPLTPELLELSAQCDAAKDWSSWPPGIARPRQRPPSGEWFVWLMLAGRGTGKSRSYAEWLDAEVRAGRTTRQVLIAGRTPSDVHDYALTGPGGLLTNHPDLEYKARTVKWPNGVDGLVRSGANPEELRGFSGSHAWLDEFAAWKYPEASWTNLMFGIREGKPRIGISTTPKNIDTLKAIMSSAGTVVVRGSSNENRANLAEVFVRNVLDRYAGTRLGRQEIEAEILDDVEGALWTLKMIDDARFAARTDDGEEARLPDMRRVVVGVDPQGTKSAAEGDEMIGGERRGKSETGIVVVGLGTDGHYYVLDDASINGTPNEWGTRIVAAYDTNQADRVVGEKNFGGDMVEHVVRSVRKTIAYEAVVASRGKTQRAEPIAALYEQGKVHHVGSFPVLESEMTTHTQESRRSPNRMDALVWALTFLTLRGAPAKRRLMPW